MSAVSKREAEKLLTERGWEILTLAYQIGSHPHAENDFNGCVLNGLLALALMEFGTATPYSNGTVRLVDAFKPDKETF